MLFLSAVRSPPLPFFRAASGAGIALVAFLLTGPVRGEPTTEPLRVLTSGDYPPFSEAALPPSPGGKDVPRDPSPRGEKDRGPDDPDRQGLDIAVARRLAADLGRPLVWESFRWPDLERRLRNEPFDLVLSGLTRRPERALFLAFSRPYARTGAVLVIRKAEAARFPDLEAARRPGVRIAVNQGGHLERVARQHFPTADLRPLSNNRDLPVRLRAGEFDAVVSESFEAATWGEDLRAIGPFTQDFKAVGVRLGDPGLLRAVDEWLEAREADGWLNAQRRRWLGGAAEWTAESAGAAAVLADLELRLGLMPLVAAAKRRDGLAILDPAQEQIVLSRISRQAAALGLAVTPAARLFEIQMELARLLQEAALAKAPKDEAAPPLIELRVAVGNASSHLLAELDRSVRRGSGLPSKRALEEMLARFRLPVTEGARLRAALESVHRADSPPTPTRP